MVVNRNSGSDRIGAQKCKIKTHEFTLGILEGLSDMDGFTHGGRCGALASCTCFRLALRAQRRLSERSWRRAMYRMLTLYYSRSCRGVKAAKDAARKTRYITGGGGGGLLERELARGLKLRCSTCHYFCSLPVLESVFVSSGSFACVDLLGGICKIGWVRGIEVVKSGGGVI